jgi:hypothetical protein
MSKILITLCFFLLISCSKVTVQKESTLNYQDSIELEESMLGIKNITFNECFYKSRINTYKRLKLDENDECYKKVLLELKDLTGYHYMNNTYIDPKWIYRDENREKLLSKWINKKEYIPFVNPPDFPDGSLDMVRALDFYNSKDMKLYIDSLKQVRVKELLSYKNSPSP